MCVSRFSRVWLFATPWYSPPGSSVQRFLQARILEWVAICFSRGQKNAQIYHFKHFKHFQVYSSIMSHHCVTHLQDSLLACKTVSIKQFPIAPYSQPLVSSILLLVSLNFDSWYVSCDWLISLSTVSSRFIHAVACVRISFPFKGWIIFPCVYGPHLFYPLSISGCVDCFRLMAVVNSGVVNMGLQISVWDPAFTSFRHMSRSGIADI